MKNNVIINTLMIIILLWNSCVVGFKSRSCPACVLAESYPSSGKWWNMLSMWLHGRWLLKVHTSTESMSSRQTQHQITVLNDRALFLTIQSQLLRIPYPAEITIFVFFLHGLTILNSHFILNIYRM